MAATIGALRVSLGADTASFEDGMKRAGNSLASFGKQASTIAAGIQLEKMIERTTRAFTEWISSAINAGEELNKLSKQTGVSVEELSKLKFAAEQSDAKIEDVAKAFQILSKNMAEASVNAKSQFARALVAMGLELKETDGALKSQSKLFSEIATKFKSYEEGAEKAALAQALFKKFGVAIIPFLNEGGEGIDKLKNRLVELGAVMGTDMAQASDQLKDTMGEFKAVLDGIAIVVAKEMLPGLQKSTEALIAFTLEGGHAKTAGEALGSMFQTVIVRLSQMIVLIQGLGTQWEKFRILMQTEIFESNPLKGFSAEFVKARDDFTKVNADIRLALDKLSNSFLPVQTEVENSITRLQTLTTALNAAGDAATNMAQKTLAPVVSLKEAKNAVEEFLKSQQKSIAGQRAEIAAMGAGTGAKERLKIEYQALQIAADNNIPVTEALRARIAAIGVEAGTAALRLEGFKLFFENQTPLVLMNQELEKTRAAFREIGITEGPALEMALDKIREKFGQTWESIGKNVADFAGSMSTLTKTIGKENKAMVIASKAFGIAQAVINAQIAATKAIALLGPTPAGFIAAAAAIAAGAAAVATIVAQGMAKGGSFMVPGAGGTDSKFIPIMATPGERVTVETPAQQQRGGGQTIIQLRGKSFGFEDVRELFESINAGMRDGHRFVAVKA